MATSSPLLEANIAGAQGVLFSITGGPGLSLFEVEEAASIIKETADPEANIIFGTVIDDRMGDDVSITVIATGFDSSRKIHRPTTPATADTSARVSRDYLRDLQDERAAAVPVMAEASVNGAATAPAAQQAAPTPSAPTAPTPPVNPLPQEAWTPPAGIPTAPPQAQKSGTPEIEDLDIPAFLRRNRDH